MVLVRSMSQSHSSGRASNPLSSQPSFTAFAARVSPELQPTFGKSRLHSAELIGRVDQPDTPIGFNDDKAARSALIRCRERRLRYGRQFMRKAHPIQAFKRRMRECNAVKHGWKKRRIGYGESSCCPRIAPSRDMTRSCRTRHGDGFAVFIKLRMKNRHRCFFH